MKGCQWDPYSPALCSCSAPPWSCRAGFAGPRRSGSYLPCCDATAARLCPSTPLRNVVTPGGGWASGLSESASRRLTGCRTGGTPGGPTRATAQRQGPPLRVSDGPAGGASQCSSGTLRSRPPAPARSAGSAAGRTGTPLCLEEKKRGATRWGSERTAGSLTGVRNLPGHSHTLGVVWKSVEALEFRSRHHHQAQNPSQRLPQNFHPSGEAVTWGEGSRVLQTG